MAFSNFPGGFKNGVTIRGVPIEMTHPGKVFWVGNNATRLDNEATASDGNDGTFLRPWATLAGATAQSAVVSGRGDVIFVRPGVAETATATNFAFNKAGVAYVGLGRGTSRPTITMDGTTDTITVSAANVSFRNFIVNSTVASLVTIFTVTTAVDLSIEDCTFKESGSGTILTLLSATGAANTADRLFLGRNTVRTVGAGTAGVVALAAHIDGLTVEENYWKTAQTGLHIVSAAASSVTNLDVRRNHFENSLTGGTVGVIYGGVAGTASIASGIVVDNTMKILGTTSTVLPVISSTIMLANNRLMKAVASTEARIVPSHATLSQFVNAVVD